MKNLSVPISIIIAGLIVAGAIVYTRSPQEKGLSQEAAQEETKKEPTKSLKKEKTVDFEINKESHIRGNPDAPVTIVEYSDFQCPFCKRFHPTVQQALDDYSDKVRWVYKHFPLDQLHPQARKAAEASECVWEQKENEGFWQFADGLFENQSRLGEDLYKELAKNLGLNMAQFEDCLSSRKYKDKVEADRQEGIKVGVRGTPGSFVNGKSVPGAVPYEFLKSAVEKALAELE